MLTDQATDLRNSIIKDGDTESSTKIITITSGKGGVGKSNITLNFALALQDKGYKVVVLDADIGLSNIDILMGITPKYTLLDLLDNKMKISEIMVEAANGLKFISGGSDLENLFDLTSNNFPYLIDQLSLLNGKTDFLLIDTGAGVNKESLKLLLASDEIFVITTTEPTSITDSYAVIKLLKNKNKEIKVNLIVNQVSNKNEGNNTANRLKIVTERFLNSEIDILGFIYKDDVVSKSVKDQIPFYINYPNSKPSRNIKILVEKYINNPNIENENSGIKTFLEKITKNIF